MTDRLSQITTQLIDDRTRWNDALRALPHAHILQTWEWGDFKQATTGWQPLRYAYLRDEQTVALVSLGIRRLGPVSLLYAPRGPVLAYEDAPLAEAVTSHLEASARRHRAIWLKIDPELPIATGIPGEEDDQAYAPGQAYRTALLGRGWHFSADQVQFRNTIVLDLRAGEEALLAAMSQNTRRKVRQAEKRGISIRSATTADIPALYDLYALTSRRDGFLIRPRDYYARLWQSFMQAGLAHALIAEHEGRAIAHVVLFHFGQTCWYFYGASSNEAREHMPNYALQWAAIQWAINQGYTRYDMWGAPDIFDESDGMWGVFQFKRGFRGTVTRTLGAWDYAPHRGLYHLYTKGVPRLRTLLRRGGES